MPGLKAEVQEADGSWLDITPALGRLRSRDGRWEAALYAYLLPSGGRDLRLGQPARLTFPAAEIDYSGRIVGLTWPGPSFIEVAPLPLRWAEEGANT